jgi:hypothetical protein
MRVLVDLKSHVLGPEPLITQVEKVPPQGVAGATPINGKYVIVASINYAHLLAMFPQFGHIYFNPLLTSDNVAELDLAAQFKDSSNTPPNPPVYYPTRAQTGRATGPPDAGQMPTHTAVLGANAAVTPARPGVLISSSIDISTPTGGVGADEFMLYWHIYGFDVTADITATFGVHAGVNTPAIRTVEEVDQEPVGFSAYISADDGINWCDAGLLEPVAFADKATEFRVAFLNTNPDKVYLATYAVLF